MEVYLKHPWFVGGRRYRRSENKNDLRTIPNQFRDNIPSTAKVVVEPEGLHKTIEEGDEELRKELDAASIATRIYKDAAHSNDGDSLPGGTDDGGAGAAAMTALADPAKASEQLGQSEYAQLQGRAKVLGLKYVGVSRDNLRASVETAEAEKE